MYCELYKPKLTLDYNGNYFTTDNFHCTELNGDYEPMFTFDDSGCVMRSIAYHVFSDNKKESYKIETMEIKGSYLAAKNYILVEKGTQGFDFEQMLFICTVAKSDGVIAITIVESQDETLRNELWELVNLNPAVVKRNAFNEYVLNKTLTPLNMRKTISHESFLKRTLQKIRETRFLDADPEDKNHKYICLDDAQELECLHAQMENGLFVPYGEGYLSGTNVERTGLLLYKKRFDTSFTILKPVELLHDMSAEMWLKASVQYRFPQDAERIANDFPQLYRELTQEKEYWRDVRPADKAPTPYRLGDKEIMLPCYCFHGLWAVKQGLFHFPAQGDSLCSDFGLSRDYFPYSTFMVSYVKHDGEEYFAVYRAYDKKRFNKDVFACFNLHRFIPLSKVLAHNDNDEMLLKILRYAYYFHTHRNNLVSTPIDEETFANLDTAVAQELTANMLEGLF